MSNTKGRDKEITISSTMFKSREWDAEGREWRAEKEIRGEGRIACNYMEHI